ncbi:MAG TPA: helix-turn-helix domain-containing GNAT family N-acetyltransferase [Acidobacteriota bacterium]|nr:helix-turn-helix domain-containing GNAT family N-acetyltransferase [Acidobacteriota bacterium]
MTRQDSGSPIAAVRQFSRFYTRRLDILRQEIYSSPFTLGQVRVLYEIAHRKDPTSTQIAEDLGLNAAYFSRLLRSLENQKLVKRTRSSTDGRRSLLSLTARGEKTFAQLSDRADEQIRTLLQKLSPSDQASLAGAMSRIKRLLEDPSREDRSFFLRTHQPGDMGQVVHSHGVLYPSEHGYNEQYEADVAEIVAKFLRHFDPKRERCWIAEKDGENVGSIFCVKESERVARLRLLLVEPKARGIGIGSQLVRQCLKFASQAGYSKIILWTQSDLDAARAIYQKFGFRCVRKDRHQSWGRSLTGETWELRLTPE